MHENVVGTWETVHIREVSIWRGSTVHDKIFSNLKFIIVKELSTFPLKKYSS